MSDFKREFKKTLIDHGTLKLKRFDKNAQGPKKFHTISCQMNGSAVHFIEWKLGEQGPRKVRFDLTSFPLVEHMVRKAIRSKDGTIYNIESDHKPKDGEKGLEGILVIYKNNRGVIQIGIALPGEDLQSTLTFDMIQSYFIRLNSYNPSTNTNEQEPIEEISARFAVDWVSNVYDMAKNIAVKDYVEPPKDGGFQGKKGGYQNNNNNRQNNNTNNGGNSYQNSNNNGSDNSSSQSFDDDFSENF